MPKVWHKYIKRDSLSGLWKISESREELMRLLHFTSAEEISNDTRARQWLASRVLLQELLLELGYTENYQLHRLPSGRPELSIPGLHISISHAGDYAAVALSKTPIGIDVEKISPRIERIQHKFMNEVEKGHLVDEKDILWMHTVWSAKEALFKYHPHGELDFREHLHLKKEAEGLLRGEIRKNEEIHRLQVPYEFFDEYILAWAIPD